MGIRSINNPTSNFASSFVDTSPTVNAGLEGDTITGGNVEGLQPGNGYAYHTFTTPGDLIIPTSQGPKTCEVLIVGGGGSGGSNAAGGGCGGGGAGALLYAPTITLTPGSYPIEVGDWTAMNPSQNQTGNPSTAFGATADGGGYGGGGGGQKGGYGGSGGGGCAGSPYGPGGYPVKNPAPTPYGTFTAYRNIGGPGTGPSSPRKGGTGGEAGDSGEEGDPTARGGEGKQYPQFKGDLIGYPVMNILDGYFAGGGGGANNGYPPGNNSMLGGNGGGGIGACWENGGDNSDPWIYGEPGFIHSGSGGGGGNMYPEVGGLAGGRGAGGIVCIRYSV